MGYPYKIKIFDFEPDYNILRQLERHNMATIPNNDRVLSYSITKKLKPIRKDIHKGPDSRYGKVRVGLVPPLKLEIVPKGKHSYIAIFKKMF